MDRYVCHAVLVRILLLFVTGFVDQTLTFWKHVTTQIALKFLVTISKAAPWILRRSLVCSFYSKWQEIFHKGWNILRRW
jgi:hypothetical protein